MRLASIVSLALVLFANQAGAQLAWSEVATLSGSNPSLAPAPGGGVHVALSDESVRHVELDASAAVVTDELVPATSGVSEAFSFGPAIAIGSGSIHVAFARNEGDWMMRALHVAKTAGAWGAVLELSGPTLRGYAPSIAVDDGGAAHVLFGAATDAPFGVARYFRVSGGSVTQTHPALIDWRADDRTAIVAGPGGVVHALAGNPSPSGYIALASSTTNGASFSGAIELEPPNLGSERIGQPHAVLDASGVLHVVYGAGEEVSGNCNCAVHYAMLSGGAVQQASVVTPTGALAPWHLSLGIARLALLPSGLRAVAWQAHAGDDAAAAVSASTSFDGQSWTSPHAVAPDCGGAEGRNTIDMVASENTLWLACPKGSSVTIHRGIENGGRACNPAAPFSGATISPAAGSGAAETFVTRLTHCEGASAFRVVQLRVTNVVDENEPAVAPSYEAGLLHLDDQNCTPGEQKLLSSTYGVLDCASSSVASSANEIVVSYSLAFDVASFGGERRLFMDAKGGSGSPEPRLGWTQLGSFVVQAQPNTIDGGAGNSAGGNGDRGGTSEASSGCGCRTPAGGAPTHGGWLLITLGLALRCRRFRATCDLYGVALAR